MGGKKKTEEDYHAIAKKRDFEWIGFFPSGVRIKTVWRCLKGHEWKVSYNCIQRGYGCPYCANQVRKVPADYNELAEEHDVKWIGPFPANTETKTWWQCKEGHKWQTRYGGIKQGKGCPYCGGTMPKVSVDYYRLAQKRKFKWIGVFPPNVSTKTEWECIEGHCWEATYNNVRGGTGCPVCAIKIRADNHRTGIVAYYTLATKRGLLWIGRKVPSDILKKTLWECKKGHQWQACYNNIRNGCGCPHCIDMVNGARVSQIQRDLCEMVNGELNYPCDSYNIDVALPKDNIAIEYDSWFWHGGKLENDKHRDKELIEADWRILHIKSNKKLPTKEQLNIAMGQLQSGKSRTEIVLDDWGQGPTFTSLRS